MTGTRTRQGLVTAGLILLGVGVVAALSMTGTGPSSRAADIPGDTVVATLSSGLRLLDLISMVAPLIGLLGTVLGMVQSFQDLSMAQGSANASVLAGGIWLALLTTAGGLVVAIPAAIGASLLTGRVETAALRIESAAGRLLTLTAQGR